MAIKFKVEEKESKLKDSNKKFKIKKNWKTKLEIFLMVLAVIGAVMMISYIAVPVISGFIGVVGYILVTCVVLLIGACTLFLIFISPGVRNGIGKYYNICNSLFHGGAEAQQALTNIFPIFAPICCGLCAISLLYSIFLFKKNTDDTLKHSYKSKMIANIAISSICVVFIIVDLIVYFANNK